MRRGFTIIEMLVVIGVIAILAGMVMVVASGAIGSSRKSRTEAMRVILEQGIATFYAQEGKWPKKIEDKIDSVDKDSYTFTDDEADKIFQEVVGKAWGKSGKKSMLLDATGLYVCDSADCGNGGKGCYDNHDDKRRSDYCGGQGCRSGASFDSSSLPISQMAFGYQGDKEGKFRRFHIVYNAKTDKVSVTK